MKYGSMAVAALMEHGEAFAPSLKTFHLQNMMKVQDFYILVIINPWKMLLNAKQGKLLVL